MTITPANCSLLGDGLDHPESVCVDDQGAIYAGREAGQLYRLEVDGQCCTNSTLPA
ncbi:hypothetical protein OAS39_12510 [Pirellulales bacterium]|nr:hypothetical protein [Pirellulales bacterium]